MKLSDIPNLESYLGKKVKVGIVGGTTFIGILKGYDGFVNVVLKIVTEPLYPNSQVIIKGKDIKKIVLVQ